MLMKLFWYKFHGFDALLGLLFSMRDWTNMDLLALVFWLIWHNRNSIRLKEQGVELHQIKDKAKDLLSNFLNAQVPQARSAMPRNSPMSWTPPIRPLEKINFDAALFKELDSIGLGIVVRNSLGSVKAALSQRVPIPFSVAMVEVLACRRTLEFAKEISALDCIFEGDAKVHFKAICMEDVSNPEYGHVIEDILVLVRDFHFSSFNHVKRSGNQVAYHLARRFKSSCKL